MVLYNPEVETLLSNCEKYVKALDKLILVDNTESSKKCLNEINSIDNLVYIDLNGNKGLAFYS